MDSASHPSGGDAMSSSISGCSGASTMNVTPNKVSGRVVYTRIGSSSEATENSISAPSLRPIHASCMRIVEVGQSRFCKPSSSRSANAVILNIHCNSGRRTTGCPPRSLRPSMTSSLANTVPSFGHQFTICFPRYAKRWSSIYADFEF